MTARFWRARYGDKADSHASLHWDGPPKELPTELLGLTDRPPGVTSPGERWWPSVGCAPLGQWWALWWTVPDFNSPRGGMVRSEVALWNLDQIGTVETLEPTLTLLSGGQPIVRPSRDALHAISTALILDEPGKLAVPDLEIWPGILASLWERLWPAAREGFSARVALSPPQGGESLRLPWLLGIPPKRAPEWIKHRVVDLRVSPKEDRAADWLVGDADSTVEEVIAACPELTADLGSLRRVVRAADRLDGLRRSASAERAADLLRTLTNIAPERNAASSLKTEALESLRANVLSAPVSAVLSLANLRAEQLPAGSLPEQQLREWIDQQAPSLPLAAGLRILELLLPRQAELWWQTAVREEISTHLHAPSPEWSKTALDWISSLGTGGQIANDLLPTDPQIERCLLSALIDARLAPTSLASIRQRAAERGWSQLHAGVLMQLYVEHEALRQQRLFTGDVFPGLGLLVNRLSGSAVVAHLIAEPAPGLERLVAERTAREPQLLGPIDPRLTAWRSLWMAHIAAGGPRWPPDCDRKSVGQELLNSALSGEDPKGLIKALAPDLADIAFELESRQILWTPSAASESRALLAPLATILLSRLEAGQGIPEPELPLAQEVLTLTSETTTTPSPVVIVAILSWAVAISEQTVIRWIKMRQYDGWAGFSAALGTAVLDKGWKRAAAEIYDLWSRGRSDFLQAAIECKPLLNWWDREVLSWSSDRHRNTAILAKRLGELGGSLAPDRLDDLWERAGGDRKFLPTGGTPDIRWLAAVNLAHNGSLPHGLRGLVDALLKDLPYNDKLRELSQLLR